MNNDSVRDLNTSGEGIDVLFMLYKNSTCPSFRTSGNRCHISFSSKDKEIALLLSDNQFVVIAEE